MKGCVDMLIVLDSGSGQMCNQMLMQANILASAYARNYRVRWYNFLKYDGISYNESDINEILTERNGNPWLKLVFAKMMYRISDKFKRNSKYVIMASNEAKVEEALKSGCLQNNNVFCYGWPFYDLTSLRKHADVVRRYFSPTQQVEDYVKKNMNKLKWGGSKVIVGVHMRRGDYRTWRNGEFFFEDTVYRKNMEILSAQLKESSLHFILFSNEPIDVAHFESNKYSVTVANGTGIQDFYMQAYCDYLIGPPSSYSGMASFLGNVPRFIVTSTEDECALDKMKVWLMETDGWVNAI